MPRRAASSSSSSSASGSTPRVVIRRRPSKAVPRLASRLLRLVSDSHATDSCEGTDVVSEQHEVALASPVSNSGSVTLTSRSLSRSDSNSDVHSDALTATGSATETNGSGSITPWSALRSDGYRIIPGVVDVSFRKKEHHEVAHRESVRVDTGASVTAIPQRIVRKLGLKPFKTVTVRMGSDHLQQRGVVMVNITCGDRNLDVEATVRNGPKLGNTVVLGRNFLTQGKFLVHTQD